MRRRRGEKTEQMLVSVVLLVQGEEDYCNRFSRHPFAWSTLHRSVSSVAAMLLFLTSAVLRGGGSTSSVARCIAGSWCINYSCPLALKATTLTGYHHPPPGPPPPKNLAVEERQRTAAPPGGVHNPKYHPAAPSAPTTWPGGSEEEGRTPGVGRPDGGGGGRNWAK